MHASQGPLRNETREHSSSIRTPGTTMAGHPNTDHAANTGDQDACSSSDLELQPVPTTHLVNSAVAALSWHDMRVSVRDRETGKPLDILSRASGLVRAGEMLAIMGPSGSGKTTLLNTLARRTAAAGATTTGSVMADATEATPSLVRGLSAYVEQEDALIGSITVRETVVFAARLALPR